MATQSSRPNDDESSAPESSTVRDGTSGNQPANPHERPPAMKPQQKKKNADHRQTGGDPSVAAEVR